ncbi:hypothetical protein [Ruminococcus sp.]|uniref:hypothetical protein n=1 Tax=Ruminococcus sp. TaxID=41978 RepID=UPI0025D3152E|nr:hypothetical protein [Ruminococcus sp.]
MVTQQEFSAIKCLVETEKQLIIRFEHYIRHANEPQLREDLQKFTASLENQKANLVNCLEDNNDN